MENRTTVAVQRYLDALPAAGGDAPAEPVVRELLGRSVNRLHQLCAGLLFGSYPRLARPPFNLQSDELLGAVAERLLKALREVRPQTVRQFFALANRHIRWELNDVARRLDKDASAVQLRESFAAAPPASTGSPPGDNAARILGAIEALPDDAREVFELVRVQGMTYGEAAEVLGVSGKTVQRRLTRSLLLLSARLGDLVDPGCVAEGVGDGPQG